MMKSLNEINLFDEIMKKFL